MFELIDDLRDKILAVYGDQLREALRASRGQGDPGESGDAGDDGLPF